MKFARWLNSLSNVDHLVILFLFILAGLLAHLTLQQVRKWYTKQQEDNPFAKKIRISPIAFFAVTIPYTIILYKLLNGYLKIWIGQLF
ncbi:MAG: hypothetical protein CMF78_02695 [Candidatus Marinimicrobia bacterium]|nr:hypothetical protein [Candidatus Neomarinimicrobiota bacterium]|tara:strand:+ start:2339 stop:2602 length:264 start_codon:yes stop_codon:yes gene_type:complete